ncbi:hypothetical protein U9M48_026531 [Paspalum notatum var. saurae]|uniref:Uncharacterized protein n=1 Tax=Paspalum notatum var. saurae TaxID=547442 RepID=A0AAQ3TSG6_PASNO
MEEDPLIPLVHGWTSAAFDQASACRARADADAAVGGRGEGDKENHRPEPGAAGVDEEIGRIEAEILRLSSRLHHLRIAQHPEPKRAEVVEAKATRPRTRPPRLSLGPLDVATAVNTDSFMERQQQQPQPQPRAAQGPKPAPAPRGRGLSLGPLDIVAANPVPASAASSTAAPQRKVQGEGRAARPILRPIMEPPVQRRRGVSLGPMEIHRGVGGKVVPAARVKPFSNKLGAVREEGQASKQHTAVPARPWPSSNNARRPLDAARQGTAASRAKARSGSMSPRTRRMSASKATETRGGNARATEARGGSAAVGVNKGADELKAKVMPGHTSNAAVAKRPAGSTKFRAVPSRYSITPGSSLTPAAAGAQEKRRKQSLPGSAAGDASQGEGIRAKLTEPSNDELSPETIAKVAEQLPRIRTMPPSDGSPRDSGCAKRVADLVGKRSFFTAAADDGNAVTPFQARVLEAESPEAAEEEA